MTTLLRQLSETRHSFVPPDGSLRTAKYAIVGEQPGNREVNSNPRKPFIGPAGRELIEDMQRVDILRSDCYMTNVFKDLDQPLNTYFSNKRNHKGPSVVGQPYYDALEEELRGFKGTLIAVGNVALHALANRYGIMRWRGSVLDSTMVPGCKVVPIIHPSTVIPPKNQYLNKILIQFDLKKAKDVSEGNFVQQERHFIMRPTYNQTIEFLTKMYDEGKDGKIVYYDIEITPNKYYEHQEVSCISFCTDYLEGISVPFIDPSDYFTPPQEATIWLLIAKILEDQSIWKCGQNISFDSHFLLRKYGIRATNLHDTMVAQRLIMPDYPIGLDFIASIWTSMQYYKDEGKNFLQGLGGSKYSQLWEYNIRDSLVCCEALPKQQRELVKYSNEPTYERQRRLIEPLVFMQERGIRVDTAGMIAASQEMEKEELRLEEELWKLCEFPLNAKSPKQVADYFYRTKGIKAYKNRKTKGEDTSVDALKRLKRRGFAEADLILRIRKQRKLRGTYAPIENGRLTKVDSDGRIRSSYNPVGTRYSRISSSKNIFGTGMNQQNWPHHLLKFLISDVGYFTFSYDLAQAENRIVAYAGRVTPMIDAFEEGKDVHSLTAGLIFNKPPQEISSDDGSCSLGGGEHSERFWGKKANHGLNYDLGYRSFALYYEIPEGDAKFIVERYHSAYPGVRQSYHAMVREQLANDRTLTNLMGRRTLFLDRWGDALFKEAYSCIPQGTVGDIINEYGVEYIYYNQDLFSPIEILLQVHDSVGGQCRLPSGSPEYTWTDVGRMFLDIKKSLEPTLNVHYRDFVIPADLTIGFNFYKGDSVEIKWKDFPGDAETLGKRMCEELKKVSQKLDLNHDDVTWRI